MPRMPKTSSGVRRRISSGRHAELTPPPRFRGRLRRDLMILGGAFLFAATLVLTTWVLTLQGREATTGRVHVVSSPENALVLLDGTEVGTTPFESAPIEQGTHIVTVRHVGYLATSRVVEVVAGDTVSVEIVLSAAKPPP